MNRKPTTATTTTLPPKASSAPRFVLGSLNARAICPTLCHGVASGLSRSASTATSQIYVSKAYGPPDRGRRAIAVPHRTPDRET